jgi:hypothetical protein
MKLKYVLSCVLILFFSAAAMANTDDNPPVVLTGDNIDIQLLNGVVLDMDSRKPLKDVNITAILQSKKEKVVSTDINGGFSFIMLKPGTYKLVFEKEGYKKVVKDKVEVKEKTPVQMNVEMPQFIPISERGPSAWHFFES